MWWRRLALTLAVGGGLGVAGIAHAQSAPEQSPAEPPVELTPAPGYQPAPPLSAQPPAVPESVVVVPVAPICDQAELKEQCPEQGVGPHRKSNLDREAQIFTGGGDSAP